MQAQRRQKREAKIREAKIREEIREAKNMEDRRDVKYRDEPIEPQYSLKFSTNSAFVYRNIAFTGTVGRLLLSFAISGFNPTLQSIKESFLVHMGVPMIVFIMFLVMMVLSSPMYSAALERQLASPGYDLNMQGDWHIYLQHLTAQLTFVHILSAISPFFWLIVPLTAMYLFWHYIIRPFVTVLFLIGHQPADIKYGIRARRRVRKQKKIKYRRTIKHWHHFR